MTIQSILRARPGWVFWVLWVLASTLAVVIFMILVQPIANIINIFLSGGENRSLSGMLNTITSTAAMGALIGLGQWLVLRLYLKRTGWWVLATCIGYSVPFLVGYLIPQVFEFLGMLNPGWITGTVLFLTFGLALGVLQWLVLRGRVNQAGWWIVISLVSWGLASALTILVYMSGLYIEPFDMLSAFFIPLMVGGAGLAWLLRRTPIPAT